MKVELKKENGLLGWIKKYGTYCLAGLLVVAIAVTITLTSGQIKTSDADISSAENPIVSVGGEALTFTLPMGNATVSKEFSSDELYFNDTLEMWEFHDGVDLTSDDLAVFAVANGNVTDIYTNYANGCVVVVSHANNFKSVYSCLNSDSLLVAVGDSVTKGEQIGTAGHSASNELADGTHLHFGLLLNDKEVDPSSYLDFENK